MQNTCMTDSARLSVKHLGFTFVVHMRWARLWGQLANAVPDRCTCGQRSVGRSCWTGMNSYSAVRAKGTLSSLDCSTPTCRSCATWLAIAVVFRRREYAVAGDGLPESRRLKDV